MKVTDAIATLENVVANTGLTEWLKPSGVFQGAGLSNVFTSLDLLKCAFKAAYDCTLDCVISSKGDSIHLYPVQILDVPESEQVCMKMGQQ